MGRLKCLTGRPSRTLPLCGCYPGVETPGYYRSFLRTKSHINRSGKNWSQQLDLRFFLLQGLDEGGHAAVAAFNDVLVDGGVVGDRIIAVVTRHAERTLRQAGRFDQAVLREIINGIRVKILADLFE